MLACLSTGLRRRLPHRAQPYLLACWLFLFLCRGKVLAYCTFLIERPIFSYAQILERILERSSDTHSSTHMGFREPKSGDFPYGPFPWFPSAALMGYRMLEDRNEQTEWFVLRPDVGDDA